MIVKRQLSEAEKSEVYEFHDGRCFVDGAPFGEDEQVEFHHIKPFSDGGLSISENIAPVCKKHHRSIGTMSLQEYRDKLELEHFFSDGEPKYLDHLIHHKKGNYGEEIKYEVHNGVVRLYFHDSGHDYPLHDCPTTGWKYFYATLPVEHIVNDSELQPRSLRQDAMWVLYRHFQVNTQLAPSICRIDENGKILLFDGQHKAAAQIWSNRPMIECKVYLEPDPRKLKETNLEAHGKFRQMSFYSHELVKKYADIFGEDWNEYYSTTEGEKSELGFFNFLVNAKKKTKQQAKNEFSLGMYNEIIDDSQNKLSEYLQEKHRGRNQPLTFARVEKTFFQHMLLSPPTEAEFESDSDLRKEEKRNIVRLMNLIVEEGLDNRWNPERADNTHHKAVRVFSAGSVRAWVILLRDVINAHLRHYTDEERTRFFYRRIPDEEFKYFRQFVQKIFAHKMWDDPDPSGEIAARLAKDDSKTAKGLFDEKGLTVQYVLGT